MPDTTAYSKVFLQDLDAYKSAIKKNDFELANTFSNRIMSNAHLFNEKDYGIIGFVLKEFAREGIIAKQLKDTSAPNTISTQIQSLLKKVDSGLKSGDASTEEFWISYRNHLTQMRKSKLTSEELSAYATLNQDFTKSVTVKVLEEFQKNLELLKYPTNNLFAGCISEISRTMDCSGLEDISFNTMCSFVMLARIYDYIRTTSTEQDFPTRIEKEMMPLVNNVLENINTLKNNPQNRVMNDVLWSLIKIWRLYFIKFAELRLPVATERRSVIKEQTKSKIAEALSKSLEKEINQEEDEQ